MEGEGKQKFDKKKKKKNAQIHRKREKENTINENSPHLILIKEAKSVETGASN